MKMLTRSRVLPSMGIVVAVLISLLQADAASKSAPPEIPSERAPAAFAVRLETTKGAVVVEAYRSWAPHAVDRFYNLVGSGYLNENLFYRVALEDGVDFGFNSDPNTRKPWSESRIPTDPPKRKIGAGDVFFLNDGFGSNPATNIRIQTGLDGSMPSGSGATPLGRVVEGIEVLDSLDSAHTRDPRKFAKLINQLWKGGDAKVRRDYPQIDSIMRATILDRVVDTPKEDPTPAGTAPVIPPGMAFVRVYRKGTKGQNFTLRIDGSARAVLKPGTVYETTLPAGQHEFSTKVKFKMFATGILDKAFATGGKFVAELEPGGLYYLRSVAAGPDMRTLRLILVAREFGAEECNGLIPAKRLEGTEEE